LLSHGCVSRSQGIVLSQSGVHHSPTESESGASLFLAFSNEEGIVPMAIDSNMTVLSPSPPPSETKRQSSAAVPFQALLNTQTNRNI